MYATMNWEDYVYVPASLAKGSNEVDKVSDDLLKSERAKREPFTSTFLTSSDPERIQQNINTIQCLDNTTSANRSLMITKYADISNNVMSYMNTTQNLHNNNDRYHYDDQLDPNVIIKREPPNNINTVIETDLNTLTLNQNSIYISSAIACATLLIAAIIIVPLQKNT